MRQILFSDGTAPAFVNNILGAGELAIVGRSDNGFTELNTIVPATIAGSDAIQLVQAGLPGDNANILTPWIKGADVIGWSGTTFRAQVPQESTLTLATPPVADGEVTVKLVSSEQGIGKFARKSVTIPVTAGEAVNDIARRIYNALAGLPDANVPAPFPAVLPVAGCPWAFISMPAVPGAVITVTGTTFSLPAGTELSSFRTASEGLDGTNGTTLTVVSVDTPDLGAGDPFVLQQVEQSLQGDRSYYNRLTQPNTPNTYVNLAIDYDVYTLRVKNNTPNQIAGVDNYRDIIIAYQDGGTDQANFELDMNTYLASCPGAFAPVTL